MKNPDFTTINRLQKLFKTPQNVIKKEFSPYFYRYFSRFFNNPGKFTGYLELCRYLFNITDAGNSCVLDLGCGFGMMATLFTLYGAKEVVGYDLNTEKVDLFNRLLLYVDPGIKNVKPVLGDSSKIGYGDAYFDIVIANESLSHVREMGNSIEEVYRVLKPGGRFLIRDGNNSFFLLGRMRRRRFWRRIELGPVDPSMFRSTDVPLPFIEVRERMILEKFPQMDKKKLRFLSKRTAGMFGYEIFDAVETFEKTGTIPVEPGFRYRNPVTGEFPEKEINPVLLRTMLVERGFKTTFVPYFYAASFKDLEMSVKRLYYLVGRYLSIFHLFLNPGFALLGVKEK
jgi:SAM-dependent methyltransferase